jgi:hypothetical protein
MQHKIEAKMKRVRYYISLLDTYKVDCQERFASDPMFGVHCCIICIWLVMGVYLLRR